MNQVSILELLVALLPLLLMLIVPIILIWWIVRVVRRHEARATEQLQLERQNAEQFQVLIERLDRIEQQLDPNAKRS
ncbi:hypothetical protein [Exiguobacterium algae]|uniref:hypothetical protein n=1 Tax=Exiguobacterium algae TaxID=2751250 RepID=UPI001BEAC6C9|nr:hypothetical protein [Exiguobacterium algae]